MKDLLDERMIDQVLENNFVGRLGYRDGERMYITPISYLFFSGRYIIVHSKEGEKIDILRKYPNVCFEVDEIDNISNYKGVLVWGKYEELTDRRERYYALDLLLRKINKQKMAEADTTDTSYPVTENMGLSSKAKSIVYRIRIEKKTGRFKKSEDRNNIGEKEQLNP